MKFGSNYFSIPLLIRTLFSHWRRYRWSYGKGGGFDIGRYISVFFSNLISRVMGAVMRTFLILFGVFFEFLIFLGGVIIFFGWLFLPVLLILGLILGFKLLF